MTKLNKIYYQKQPKMKGLKLNVKTCLKYISCIVLASFIIQACDFVSGRQAPNSIQKESQKELKTKSHHNALAQANSNQNRNEQFWDRIRKNFKIVKQNLNIAGNKDHPKVKQFVKEFKGQENKLVKASPYLYYIVEQLEKRNMPTELAFLPMIESSFEPHATSHKGAAGLWQFIPGTGRQFGLKQDASYDGRRDIQASTKAALDYLSLLHKEFNQNWMLALAAYNAGEGRIRKAIAKNKRAGKSTNFWSLPLPKETLNYVPKFLALAELISQAEKHSLKLPKIENKPYFVPVETDKHLDLNAAAKLADLPLIEVKRLNPGQKGSIMSPKGPRELLLPIDNAQKFEENVSKGK